MRRDREFGRRLILGVLSATTSLLVISCQAKEYAEGARESLAPEEARSSDAGAAAPRNPTTGEGVAPAPGEDEPGAELGLTPNDGVTSQSGGTQCDPIDPTCSPLGDAGATGPVCVPTGPRDCGSELDNDCDGQLDNVLDDVCRCTPGAVEACDEHPGFDGLGSCTAGTRTCNVTADAGSSSSDWGACEGAVAPGAADSCTVAGDDTDCDGLPNEGCACVDGATQQCGSSTDVAGCAFGTSTCVNGAFGQCVGAVPPAPRDSCAPGNDANCNGIPNEGCGCIDGETRSCGSDIGSCEVGTQTCVNGAFSGQCVGAVGPGARDLCSARGNDANCNGIPNEGCECIDGETRSCGATDVGACSFGTQTCVNGTFTQQCVGAVNPGPRDCGSAQDNDCNGLPDNTPDAVCAPPLVALGEPCQSADQCDSPGIAPTCEFFFSDEDEDGFSPSLASEERLCANITFLPRFRTRLEPIDSDTRDCRDDNPRVHPGQEQFFSEAISGIAVTNPAAFDYNCDGDTEFQYRDEHIRSFAPGGSPSCNFAQLQVCNGGHVWRESLIDGEQVVVTACGQPSFLETCGAENPQPSFPDRGCRSDDIVPEVVACR
jgi:hypothetical protein